MSAGRRWALLALAVVAMLLLAGCEKAEPQGDAWPLRIDAATLDGAQVKGDAFADNTLTVVNVWGTWCSSCIRELPQLQAASEARREQGVVFIGIVQDSVTDLGVPNARTTQAARNLLAQAGVTYANLVPDETIITHVLRQTQYFPTTLFVDAGGQVVETAIGAKSSEELLEIIDTLLAG